MKKKVHRISIPIDKVDWQDFKAACGKKVPKNAAAWHVREAMRLYLEKLKA